MTDANPAPRMGEDLRQTNPDPAQETAPAKLTRFERLRQKIKTLKGDDPDIYPMW